VAGGVAREQVATSYFAVLSAQDALDVVEAQRHAIQEQFEAAREGFAAGNATITDQQEAQARLDLNRAQLAAARHALQGRQASFTQPAWSRPNKISSPTMLAGSLRWVRCKSTSPAARQAKTIMSARNMVTGLS